MKRNLIAICIMYSFLFITCMSQYLVIDNIKKEPPIGIYANEKTATIRIENFKDNREEYYNKLYSDIYVALDTNEVGLYKYVFYDPKLIYVKNLSTSIKNSFKEIFNSERINISHGNDNYDLLIKGEILSYYAAVGTDLKNNDVNNLRPLAATIISGIAPAILKIYLVDAKNKEIIWSGVAKGTAQEDEIHASLMKPAQNHIKGMLKLTLQRAIYDLIQNPSFKKNIIK